MNNNLKDLFKFSNNMDLIKPGSSLHNMYIITLTDENGNEEKYYGCNVMTDNFFQNGGYGGIRGNTNEGRIFIGVVPSSPQVYEDYMTDDRYISRDNIKENIDHLFNEKITKYNSETGDVVSLVKICKTTYEYNLVDNFGNIISDIIHINEIGYGPAYNQLLSHSRVYDINGILSVIDKRPDQALTIELYWRMSVNKSVYESLWENGIYGAFDPLVLLTTVNLSDSGGNVGNDYALPSIRLLLSKCCGLLTISNTTSTDWPGYNLGHAPYKSYTSGDGTITLTQDNTVSTWVSNSDQNSYLMELDTRDFFTGIEAVANSSVGTSATWHAYFASSSPMYLYKPYKLTTPEELTMFTRTDGVYSSKLYEVLGVNNRGNANFKNADARSSLQGHIPVTDMIIKKLYRYNFEDADWTTEVSAYNPSTLPDDAYDPAYEYDIATWCRATKVSMECPDSIVRNVYIHTNPGNDQHIIFGFKNVPAETILYATDTWWDTASWTLIENKSLLDQNLQHRKYYISTSEPKGSISSGYKENVASNYWWLIPDIRYTNGVHRLNINDSPIRIGPTNEKDTLQPMKTNMINITVVNESCNFYVHDNTWIKKFTAFPDGFVDINLLDLFENKSPMYKCGSFIYMDNGYAISLLKGSSSNEIIFGMINLGLDAPYIISNNVEIVDTSGTFSTSITNKTYAGIIAVGSKYLLFIPATPVEVDNVTGYEWAVYDTELGGPYKLPELLPVSTLPSTTQYIGNSITYVHGTSNMVLIAPGGSFEHFTFYDVTTGPTNETFDLPSNYTFINMFAFDNYVYIRCETNNNQVMLLYNRSDQSFTPVEYPEELNTYSFAFGFRIQREHSGSSTNSTTSIITFANNVCCQYHNDGIGIMSEPLSSVNGEYVNKTNPMLIFSKFNPDKIVKQQFPYGQYSVNNLANVFIGGMCLRKMYDSYYAFIQSKMDNNNYKYSITSIFDVGRIVRNGVPIESDEEIALCDLWASKRNGTGNSPYVSGPCKFVPWAHQNLTCVFTVTSDEGYNEGTYKIPFDNFITYKIKIKTYTCTRWNNPKRITLPQISFTVTNHV